MFQYGTVYSSLQCPPGVVFSCSWLQLPCRILPFLFLLERVFFSEIYCTTVILFNDHVLWLCQVDYAVKRLATDWRVRVRSRAEEEWRFSSLLRVQTKVHSVSCIVLYVSPVESAAPGGCGDSNRFRPKPRVHGLVGHLPRDSYVCLVGQSLRGRWWGWRRNGGDTGGSATDFLAFALRLRKTPENLS